VWSALGRCWRDPEAPQDASDRGRADSAADLEQFALNTLVAPSRVLPRELLDEDGEFGIYGRAPGAVRVGPLLRNQAAVPAQDGGRCDQPVREELAGEMSAEGAEHGPVCPVRPRHGVGSPQAPQPQGAGQATQRPSTPRTEPAMSATR
jgi:hypothetical protein